MALRAPIYFVMMRTGGISSPGLGNWLRKRAPAFFLIILNNVPLIPPKRVLAVLIVIAVFIVQPKATIIYIIVIIVALTLFFSKVDYSAEKSRRGSARNLAESKWIEAEKRWKREAGDGLFNEKLGSLRILKSQYENIPADYEKEKKKLHSMVRQRQLHKFLDGFFIEGHGIKGIGPGRKAVLASFGIETAADAYSDPNRPPIPFQTGRAFRSKPATL